MSPAELLALSFLAAGGPSRGLPPGAVTLASDLQAWDHAGPIRVEDGGLSCEAGAALVTRARPTHLTLYLEFELGEDSLARIEVAPELELMLAPGAGCGSILGRSAMEATPGRGAGVWQGLLVDVVAPYGSERRVAGDVSVRLNGKHIHDTQRAGDEPWPLALRVDRGRLRVRHSWLLDRSPKRGWKPLFDGHTLSGWTRRGGQATYRAGNGRIVGRTAPSTPNTFLCTDQDYGDFVLELEFRVDSELNSGIQIRSLSRPEVNNGQVHGYQVEIDPSPRAFTGGIYDEGRRGWLAQVGEDAPARGAFEPDAWNHLLIAAEGPRLRTWLNGLPAVDLEDTMTPSGFIGLQVHSVGDRQEPLEIAWRGLWLRELDGEPPAGDR